MINLFGEKTSSQKNLSSISIILSDSYKKELLEDIFISRIKNYSGRLDEDLTEDDINKIKQNVLDMFNFHIQKSSVKKGVDFTNDKRLILYLTRCGEDKSEFLVRNLINYKTPQPTPEDLIQPVLETYKKDFATTVKYCTLGYINMKRKERLYD